MITEPAANDGTLDLIVCTPGAGTSNSATLIASRTVRAGGVIPPNATLVFEVDLLGVG